MKKVFLIELSPLVDAFAPPDRLTDAKVTFDRSSFKAGRTPNV